MQWMREEETAWDTKGPAFLVKMRGALDAQGRLVGYEYNARSCDYNHLGYNEPDTVLIGGGSVIVGPLGQVLAGPHSAGEAVLTADLDLGDLARAKYDLDVTGHYARPDIFRLTVDETRKPAVVRVADGE